MRMVYCKQTDGSHPCEGHSQGVINCLEKDTGRSCHNWTRILCEIELRIHPNQTLLLLLFSLTLCNPKDCSTPGFPVLHYFPGSVQTYVESMILSISSSVAPFSCCPQSFPTPGSFPRSQHQTDLSIPYVRVLTPRTHRMNCLTCSNCSTPF